MTERIPVSMVVNGVPTVAEVEPRRSLVEFLREDLGLVGAHVGCEHGVCGTCTVLMNGESVRSCLMFTVQANGAEIQTVEGLAANGELHPLQEAFREKQGLQCGFCTPAMLLLALELLGENPNPTAAEVRQGIAGNLCRCTGYQFIIEAVLAAAERVPIVVGEPA
jgi:aerobic-type carbon monoxide dehydrogenase small subunit (CoxS/CutS family)